MSETNRSALKEFLASIATIKGDLANITAPPFLLASQSTVEFPSYWAEHPSIFVAPASEPDPEKRALLVLKWFLAALKRQQYAGRDEKDGVKKPLNAFLGELFFADWTDEAGTTKLVSEQVSHHPPITACYLWNDDHGVRADGFACQSITFNGSVNIKQMGHAILHVVKYDEDYLIPLPNVKVQGLLTGSPYPELSGTYQIISSSGYVSEIDFSGKKLFGISGKKNIVRATLSGRRDAGKSKPLYTVEGTWNDKFTIRDEGSGKDIEVYDTSANPATPLRTADSTLQDAWESRKAWGQTIQSLNNGQMQAASDAKSKVEEGQREMRRQEAQQRNKWQPVFFRNDPQDERYSKLASLAETTPELDPQLGFWRFDLDKADAARKPFHGESRPDNTAS
ncbi:hypothetical protein AAFC00_003959 [Neodothiora populina]|uniref:Oxysterol-binding protein n=1 Tax=Neodothiora populina TaxID=2781224 RepID=A0ABR3PIB0_9PEZI